MKTKSILFLIIIFCLGLTKGFSQQFYYWSGETKNELKIDSINVIVKLKESIGIERFKTESKKIGKIKKIERLKSNKLLLLSLNSNADSSFFRNLKNVGVSVEKAMFAYKFEGKMPFFLTGEILLQPKNDVSINEIIKYIGNKAEVVKTTKYNTFKLEVENWNKLFFIANKIYESGLVEYCHPNFITEIVRNQEDPLYTEQYYLNNTGQFGGTSGIDINAPEAWQLSVGLSTTRVAVIDDGVENHEDINGRVLQGFTPTDANGFGAPVDNLPPEDLLMIGHGEACAGIIAATHNNLGIAGIAPNSQIVPVNIFNDWFIYTNPYGDRSVRFRETAEDIAEAIDWAWDDGEADVLSNSWGYNTTSVVSDAIVQAINRARTQGRNDLGSVVVFSSGNYNQLFSGVCFPANVDGVVTVGAIDNSGNLWNYSSRGSEMDLVTPSGNINLNGNLRTTDRMDNNGYNDGNYMTNFGGTSAACPQVSGVVVLMLSANPNLTESEIVNILRNTATDMGNNGFDNDFGYGRVNAFTAVCETYSSNMYVTGSSEVCESGATFTLHNRPPGATVTWSSDFGLGPVSGQGTDNYTVQAISNDYRAPSAVKATIDGACGQIELIKNTWVGRPGLPVTTPDGDPPMEVIYGRSYLVRLFHPPGAEASTGVWSANGSITITSGNTGPSIVFKVTGWDYGQWKVNTSNSCGISDTYTGAVYMPGWRFSMYPNPADDYVEITAEKKEYDTKGVVSDSYEVRIYSILKSLVYESAKTDLPLLRISTKQFLNGTYFVHFTAGEQKEVKQLIINH